MARGYIVEEVRVTGGSMRLRDSNTGELIDVAITPGAAFTPPKPADRREAGASVTAPTTPPAEDLPASKKTVAASADESDARTADKRKKKKRANKKTEQRPETAAAPSAAALHSHDKPRLSIRYSIAGETTIGPLVNVALLLHMGTSEPVLFQRDGVQLHSPKSQPEDVLESLFQDVIDQDDAKLLRRLGKFLGPVLPSAKFRELTERDENDTLAEDLVHALSETDVTFVDVGAIDTAPMTTQESREIVIDESTLSDDDKAALRSVRTILARSRHNKRGELGWKEITVDGRSGVMARWGKGQFKILHAGDDTYALFYEWDGGKWQQIACGTAEDLMHIAARRAKEEVPMAPITTLTLEMARFFCGTPAQKAVARKRLEPVFQEQSIALSKPLDLDLSQGNLVVKIKKPPREADAATTADTEVNPALDDKIGGSLKKVLEEME
jgi:hypothetical protein